jgi:hypothetical protein
MKNEYVNLVESVNKNLLLEQKFNEEVTSFLASSEVKLLEDKNGDLAYVAGATLKDPKFGADVVNVFRDEDGISSLLLDVTKKIKTPAHQQTLGKLLYMLYTYQAKKGGIIRRMLGKGKGLKELSKLGPEVAKGVEMAKKIIDRNLKNANLSSSNTTDDESLTPEIEQFPKLTQTIKDNNEKLLTKVYRQVAKDVSVIPDTFMEHEALLDSVRDAVVEKIFKDNASSISAKTKLNKTQITLSDKDLEQLIKDTYKAEFDSSSSGTGIDVSKLVTELKSFTTSSKGSSPSKVPSVIRTKLTTIVNGSSLSNPQKLAIMKDIDKIIEETAKSLKVDMDAKGIDSLKKVSAKTLELKLDEQIEKYLKVKHPSLVVTTP